MKRHVSVASVEPSVGSVSKCEPSVEPSVEQVLSQVWVPEQFHEDPQQQAHAHIMACAHCFDKMGKEKGPQQRFH